MQVNHFTRRPLSDHPEWPKLKMGEIFHFLFSWWVWQTFAGLPILVMTLLISIDGLPFVALAFVAFASIEYGVLGGVAAVLAIIALGLALLLLPLDRYAVLLGRYWKILIAPCVWKLQLCFERLDKVPRDLPPVLFIHDESVYQAVDVRKGWVSCFDKGRSKNRFPRSKCFLPGPHDMTLLAEFEAEREAAKVAARQSTAHRGGANAYT